MWEPLFESENVVLGLVKAWVVDILMYAEV